MAIYDIFEHIEKNNELNKDPSNLINISNIDEIKNSMPNASCFSAIAVRLVFFILLVIDIVWGSLTIVMFVLSLVFNLLSLFKFPKVKKYFFSRWLNIKRCFICAVSLLVAIFSPALGTMFAYTYFLMYDKDGIEEIVPTILQEHFKEFLNNC